MPVSAHQLFTILQQPDGFKYSTDETETDGNDHAVDYIKLITLALLNIMQH